MDRILEHLLRPTFLFSVLLAVGVANLWRKRRETRWRLLLVTVPFIVLTLVSIPGVAYLALGSLEWQYDRSERVPTPGGAIVVLSGHGRASEDDRQQAEMGNDVFYRCMHAMSLYQKSRACRILISGGPADGDMLAPRMATVMRDFLLEQGVKPDDLWIENRSRNTHESAVESIRILKEHRVRQAVLIADARHMVRAMRCFRKAEIDIIASPCNFTTAKFRNQWDEFVPSPAGADRFQDAFREWLALLHYRMRGWI